MTNAIDCARYHFLQSTRDRIRDELGLNDCYVIGNVGRFSNQKNHPFIIELFAQMKKEKNNVKLLLIGDGECFSPIKQMIDKKGLSEDVILLGRREDVSDILNAMDVFVLPSHSEGLPIVLVEAQANGLPALVSNLVTDEVKYSDMIQYLPIDNGYEEWKRWLLSGKLCRYICPDNLDDYEIKCAVPELEKYYTQLLEEKHG